MYGYLVPSGSTNSVFTPAIKNRGKKELSIWSRGGLKLDKRKKGSEGGGGGSARESAQWIQGQVKYGKSDIQRERKTERGKRYMQWSVWDGR